ncbi:MAG: IS1182 family transposase [Microthrixaceae bacterium]
MQGTSDSNVELLDAAAFVSHLVPDDSVYAFLAEHRRRLFPDDGFADLFPSGRGRPSQPGDVIASVLVLQSLEGLSDREATQALATDLRWKVACGLSITDPGFHPTTLTQWRNRLRRSDRPERIFDAVRDVIGSTNVLANKHRRALDSTLLDDAVATQDTVTQLVSMMRRVRTAIPAAAAVEVVGDDYKAGSGKPACAWNDPAARDELVTRLVNDALAVLAAVEDVDLDETQQRLVALLALVAGQDVEPGDEDGTWKIERRVAKHRTISTVDPETRHMHKSRSSYRDGYKAHVAVEPDTGLITACDLTPANEGDGPTGIELLDGEPEGLDVLADSAYGSGDSLAALTDAKQRPVIKPWPLARNPNLDNNQFTRDDFVIDYTARAVTCPNQITTHITDKGTATFGAKCRGCPLRSRCTAAVGGRTLHVSDNDEHLAANRKTWRTDSDLIADYRQHRPMVERTIAWLVANGHRRCRHRGVDRNKIALSTRAAVINLKRLINLGLAHDGTTWNLTPSGSTS